MYKYGTYAGNVPPTNYSIKEQKVHKDSLSQLLTVIEARVHCVHRARVGKRR